MTKKIEILDLESALKQGVINYKASFKSLLPHILLLWGILALISYYKIAGIAVFMLFSGMILLSMENEIYSQSYNFRDANTTVIKKFTDYFLSGFIISLVVYPLMTIGYTIFVIPAVLIFTFIMFSWSISVKKKIFAFDAIIESFDIGKGLRFRLFMMSLIFFALELFIYNLFSDFPIILSLFTALSIPFILSVVDELHEQMEKK